jgi:hypothetical protein
MLPNEQDHYETLYMYMQNAILYEYDDHTERKEKERDAFLFDSHRFINWELVTNLPVISIPKASSNSVIPISAACSLDSVQP